MNQSKGQHRIDEVLLKITAVFPSFQREPRQKSRERMKLVSGQTSFKEDLGFSSLKRVDVTT